MKNAVCAAIAIFGSAFVALFGGWDTGMVTLIIFMAIDYISGVIVAGVFHNSPKSTNGSLESRAGFKGLCRKFITLVFVLIGNRLDLVIGTNYIRDAVCIAFIANETISIIENAGLMGVPIPAVLIEAIEILKDNVDNENTNTDKK